MSKIKAKRKKYTGKEIRAARQENNVSVLQELAKLVLANENVSISEAETGASVLGSSRLEGSICRVPLATVPKAQDYIFGVLYRAYHRDLEGEFGIEKFSGDFRFLARVVPIEEKREDVIRLNEYCASWAKNFERNNHSDQVLNLVINETMPDLKQLLHLVETRAITQADYDYKRKGIILLSKYLYLKVKAIEEDYTPEELVIDFNGIKIQIEPWSMVHILNRHYALAAKQLATGKSFHNDESIRFFEQPDQLAELLTQIGTATRSVDVKYIPFKLNGAIYAVYTEDKVGNRKGERYTYKRLQTFYPIESESQLKELEEKYTEIQISDTLSGFISKNTA